MSLLDARNLSKSYGAVDVLDGISISLPHQARVALVGPNGVGKTTLLRLLAGVERPDSGEIHRVKNLKVGYLPQELAASARPAGAPTRRLWDLALSARQGLVDMEHHLAELEAAMARPEQAESALDRYGPLQEAFERAGGYTFRSEISAVLTGLGFDRHDHQRSIDDLSGGERTRAQLALLILRDPGLLLLDEPTNHLDLESVVWLEAWLRDWPGALVVVSHDRYFIDHVADHVAELSTRRLELYRGNYTSYAHQRTERAAFHSEEYARQQAFIARQEDYIRRNIAGQNTRQAQGRRKRLERFVRDEAIERPESDRDLRLGFEAVGRSGDRVLRTEGLIVRHPDGDRPLFVVPDLELERGECAALIGPNGVGKTTLLRTLVGEIEPWRGEVFQGSAVQIAYFAQAHEGLDPDDTVLQSFLRVSSDQSIARARDVLAQFLFTADKVEASVASLSGGERGRLVLARLAQQEANLLLLDEPTNHLDLPSQEVLQSALASYPGTILLVSHDRYLIDALATQIWSVSKGETRMEVHLGDYQSFLAGPERAEPPDSRSKPPKPRQLARHPKPPGEARRLEHIEARIQELKSELTLLAAGIEAAAGDVAEITRLGEQYVTVKENLDQELATWERLARPDEGA